MGSPEVDFYTKFPFPPWYTPKIPLKKFACGGLLLFWKSQKLEIPRVFIILKIPSGFFLEFLLFEIDGGLARYASFPVSKMTSNSTGNLLNIFSHLHYLDPIFTSASGTSGQSSRPGMQNTQCSVPALTGRRLYYSQNLSWFACAVDLDVFTVAGKPLTVSVIRKNSNGARTRILMFNARNATLPFEKRSTRLGRTNWYDLWGTQCNTTVQNSPPQARKFLGFSTAIS